MREKGKKEQFIQCCGLLVKRSEEVRQATDAAREVEIAFSKDIEAWLAAKSTREVKAKDVAEKVWHVF